MLWLGIHLPSLPLEVFENSEKPLAVSNDKYIVAANNIALQQGVEASLNIASALSLSPDLKLIQRDIYKEQKTLLALAEITYQFSHQILPHTNSRQEQSLLLEIAGSLKLFNGREALLKKISGALSQNNLREQGFTHSLAVANNYQMAEIMARFNADSLVNNAMSYPEKTTTNVPIAFLDTSARNIQYCSDMGLENISDLINLPAPALRKRFKSDFFLYLQQIRGDQSQHPVFFIPPDHFARERYFIDGLRSHSDLHHPMRSLLKELCAYLIQRQWQCLSLQWTFTRFSHKQNSLNLQFSQPQYCFDSLFQLTLLQLDQLPLDSPIESIALKTRDFFTVQQQNKDMFNTQNARGNALLLADKLTAKLGQQSLYKISQHNQHLPEKITQTTAITNNQLPKSPASLQQDRLTRPAWLLKKPQVLQIKNQQLFHGKYYLQIIRGPERIEGLWWQHKASRDYFVAAIKNHSTTITTTTTNNNNNSNTNNSSSKQKGLCWIFHDRINKRWYLHGLFA